jgi:hypothetical protein
LPILVAACGNDPVNLAGNYTVALTDRDNGCNLAYWTGDPNGTEIRVTIAQFDGDATVDVDGPAQLALDLGFGSHTFTGTVSGGSVDAAILGVVAQHTGNCTFTYDAEIYGTLSGNALTGFVHYTAASNGNPDCATIDNCVSTQYFTGSRPPL